MLASDVHGTVGSLAGVLELVMDRATVQSIVSDLHTAVTDLGERQAALSQVASSSYGASSRGAWVSGHTDQAYAAVTEALIDINAAIEHYVASLKGVASDTDQADEAALLAQQELTAAVEYTQAATGHGGH